MLTWVIWSWETAAGKALIGSLGPDGKSTVVSLPSVLRNRKFKMPARATFRSPPTLKREIVIVTRLR